MSSWSSPVSVDLTLGTSDEHISLLTHLHPLFTPTPARPTTPTSILITTPQTTALNDTVKSLSFTKKLALPVLGLVENMAGYACPCCGEISDTFGRGGGEAMAEKNGIGFLGRVPIDTVLVGLLDAVSKGELPGADPSIQSNEEATTKDGAAATNGEKATDASAAGIERVAIHADFPLLDRYNKTTSSKVWKGITDGITSKIEQRRTDISARLGQES